MSNKVVNPFPNRCEDTELNLFQPSLLLINMAGLLSLMNCLGWGAIYAGSCADHGLLLRPRGMFEMHSPPDLFSPQQRTRDVSFNNLFGLNKNSENALTSRLPVSVSRSLSTPLWAMSRWPADSLLGALHVLVQGCNETKRGEGGELTHIRSVATPHPP